MFHFLPESTKNPFFSFFFIEIVDNNNKTILLFQKNTVELFAVEDITKNTR